MPRVINVTNPRALLVPQNAALIKRAVSSVEFAAPGGPDSVAAEVFAHAQDPTLFLLLGMEEGEPRSMAIGFFPTSTLFPYPVISLMYNEGSRDLLKAMGRALFNVISEQGYSKAWAINGTEHGDAAWTRLFTPEGTRAKTIGSLLEFALE